MGFETLHRKYGSGVPLRVEGDVPSDWPRNMKVMHLIGGMKRLYYKYEGQFKKIGHTGEDLYSIMALHTTKSLDKYDPDKGCMLRTFAWNYVNHACLEIIRNATTRNKCVPDSFVISGDLHSFGEDDLATIIELEVDDRTGETEVIEKIYDEDALACLRRNLDCLTPRQRAVLEWIGSGKTANALAKEWEVCESRIHQIMCESRIKLQRKCQIEGYAALTPAPSST